MTAVDHRQRNGHEPYDAYDIARAGARRHATSAPPERAAAPGSPKARRNLRSLGMTAKLLAGFGAVALILLLVGTMAYRGISKLDASATTLAVDGLQATSDLQEFGKHLLHADRDANAHLAASTASEQRAAEVSAGENDKEADEHAERVLTLYVLPDSVKSQTKEAWDKAKEYRAFRDQKVFVASRTNKAEATQLQIENERTLDEVFEHLEAAIVDNDADNERLIASTHDTADSVKRTTLMLLGVGLAIAIAIAIFTARMIVGPAREMAAVLNNVTEGDLRVRAETRGNDELGQIAQSLNESLESTRSIIATLGSAATRLSQASEELAANAQQVASNVQTAAAGTEEMTASIQEIARNAQEATRVADDAVRLTAESSQMVADLDEASSEIGHVVEMINSIAEQTNLLALNATIEAARAGDAGRGFAVVANEVKELAQNTSSATQSIRSMVEQIQTKSSFARTAIEQISDVIRTINESQITIASAVEEQTVTTAEMARQLSDAAMGATSISGVGTTERGTGSAADISHMAAELESAVGRFTY